jgi:hypothetical protein
MNQEEPQNDKHKKFKLPLALQKRRQCDCIDRWQAREIRSADRLTCLVVQSSTGLGQISLLTA